MDVSCPRCKTEYEFDDARVPESGVTVKCTSCNHVFRVRKKTAPAMVSVPSPMARVGDETIPAKSPSLQQPATREWKVRQPSGNIFSFKELTTLQKWIVERKVSRDDEISLTGEAWKRLGNIAELASFFQIVDDAKKVHELEALQQMKDKLTTKPEAEPAPVPPPPPPSSGPRSASQSGSVPAPGERAGVLPAFESTPPPRPKLHEPPAHEPRRQLTETLREPTFNSLPPRPPPEEKPAYRPPPLPIQARREILPGIEEETQRPPRKSGGGAGTIIAVLLVLLGLGGAGGYYYVVMMPAQQRAKEAADIEARAKEAEEAKAKEEEARVAAEKAEADRKAKEAADAEKKKKEGEVAKVAPVATADAGVAVAKKTPPPPDGETPPDKGEKKEPPKKSADHWITQGDRLRDKDRAEAALEAYGKALEISPENVEALTGKGLCLLDMAKPMQAEPMLEQALKMNPRYAPAIMGLAESYRFQGKKESAIAMYQKYLDAFPNGPEASVARSNIERLK